MKRNSKEHTLVNQNQRRNKWIAHNGNEERK